MERPVPFGFPPGKPIFPFKWKALQVTKSGIVPSDHLGLFTVIEQVQKTEHKQDNSKRLQTRGEVYFNRPAGWKKLIEQ